MLTAEQKRKLDTYFGFARKEKGIYAGMMLEEKLERRKVSLLIFLPSCSLKAKNQLTRLAENTDDIVLLDYQADYPVNLSCGYEMLKAVGIKDPNLSKAIYKTLSEDVTVSESQKKEETI